MDIKKCVNDISGMLNIAPPKISFETSIFPTKTTLAVADFENNTLYIKLNAKSEFDLLFAIAHELRHLWQYLNHKDRFMENYKQSDKLSVELYNLQPAEVDANAYAALIMMTQLGVEPLWHGLSDEVINAINDRVNDISRGKE